MAGSCGVTAVLGETARYLFFVCTSNINKIRFLETVLFPTLCSLSAERWSKHLDSAVTFLFKKSLHCRRLCVQV